MLIFFRVAVQDHLLKGMLILYSADLKKLSELQLLMKGRFEVSSVAKRCCTSHGAKGNKVLSVSWSWGCSTLRGGTQRLSGDLIFAAGAGIFPIDAMGFRAGLAWEKLNSVLALPSFPPVKVLFGKRESCKAGSDWAPQRCCLSPLGFSNIRAHNLVQQTWLTSYACEQKRLPVIRKWQLLTQSIKVCTQVPGGTRARLDRLSHLP